MFPFADTGSFLAGVCHFICRGVRDRKHSGSDLMNLGLSSNGIGVWDSNIRKGVRGPRTPGQRRARSDCEGWPLYRGIKNSIFCCLTDSFCNVFMPRLLWIAITSGSGKPFVQLAYKASASSHLATSLQSSSGGRYQSTKSSTRNMPYNGENSGSD